MNFNKIFAVLFAAFVLMLVQNVSSMPRDVQSLPTNDEICESGCELAEVTKSASPIEPSTTGLSVLAGRVSCLFEEATEDPVCQEHCLPKGYSYGICVSNTCSCI